MVHSSEFDKSRLSSSESQYRDLEKTISVIRESIRQLYERTEKLSTDTYTNMGFYNSMMELKGNVKELIDIVNDEKIINVIAKDELRFMTTGHLGKEIKLINSSIDDRDISKLQERLSKTRILVMNDNYDLGRRIASFVKRVLSPIHDGVRIALFPNNQRITELIKNYLGEVKEMKENLPYYIGRLNADLAVQDYLTQIYKTLASTSISSNELWNTLSKLRVKLKENKSG